MKNNKVGIYNVEAITDIGNRRADNQDNFSVNGIYKEKEEHRFHTANCYDDRLLLTVCDGMGGEDMGQEASFLAVSSSGMLYEKLKNLKEDVDCKITYRDITLTVKDYVKNVNSFINRMILENNCKQGGTTLALTYIQNGKAYIYSLGDSRVYLYHKGKLVQISEDHTLAMRKYKKNIYTKEEAMKSKDSHKLTKFLGSENEYEVQQYGVIELQKGDIIMMCSDGLYDMCTDEEIRKIFEENASNGNYTKKLVELALMNGGKDNITCVTAQINKDVETEKEKSKFYEENVTTKVLGGNYDEGITRIYERQDEKKDNILEQNINVNQKCDDILEQNTNVNQEYIETNNIEQEMVSNRKSKKGLIFILFIVCIVTFLLGFFGWKEYKKNEDSINEKLENIINEIKE